MTRRTPLKARKKPGFKERAPEVWAAILERSEGRCELRAFPGCLGIAQHAHHLVGQAHPFPGMDTEENCRAACDPCNDHVETMGEEAYERGFKIRSWEAPR